MTSKNSLARLEREGKLRRQKPDIGQMNDLLDAAWRNFEAAGEILGPDFSDLIRKIQKFRIKRSACVYDPQGLIGRGEAEAIRQTAKVFWAKVRERLERLDPQLRLVKEF